MRLPSGSGGPSWTAQTVCSAHCVQTVCEAYILFTVLLSVLIR